MWDVESLACLATLQGHSGAVRALAASPDRVFSGSDDTTIKARQHWPAASVDSSCPSLTALSRPRLRALPARRQSCDPFEHAWEANVPSRDAEDGEA